MRARFRDCRSGAVSDLKPARPPHLAWSLQAGPPGTLESVRVGHCGQALESALRHLGFELEPVEPARAELHFGAGEPAAGALWLKPGAGPAQPESAAGRFSAGALRLWALRRRYSEAAGASWESELDAAAEEERRLRSSAEALAARASGMPNAAGLAGYRKRLRDALSADFDAPAALACAWDALRPGGLSPASQLAALREADAALGLGLFPSKA